MKKNLSLALIILLISISAYGNTSITKSHIDKFISFANTLSNDPDNDLTYGYYPYSQDDLLGPLECDKETPSSILEYFSYSIYQIYKHGEKSTSDRKTLRQLEQNAKDEINSTYLQNDYIFCMSSAMEYNTTYLYHQLSSGDLTIQWTVRLFDY